MRRFQVQADGGGRYFGAEEEIRNLPDEYKNPLLKQIEAASQGKQMEAITIPKAELEKAGWMDEETMKALAEEESESIHDEEPKKNLIRRKTPSPDLEKAKELGIMRGRLNRLEQMMREMITNFPDKKSVGDCETCPMRSVAEKVIEKTLEKI